MSWLFKSLQIDDPDPDTDSDSTGNDRSPQGEISSDSRGGGVKEDFSIIGHTIGRQLRGVAAFLAPPPLSDSAVESPPSDPSPSPAIAGIRNDLAEIGGSFKSGLSRLSSNKAVSEISKLASNFWQFQISEEDERGYDRDEDDPGDGSPGITEEIVGFVEEISIRSECWTDFPLSLDNDLKISDAQRQHASAIQQLVPELTALRSNLSTCMTDEQFWMIYFILLLPRLSSQDLELLTTPQIVETRDLLLEKLQKRRKSLGEGSKSSPTSQEDNDRQAENAEAADNPDAAPPPEVPHEETTDQTSEETDTDKPAFNRTSKNAEDQEDDFSFSDLEDNDSDLSYKRSSRGTAREPSPSGSSDWIQLKRSPKRPGAKTRESDGEEESSDWLAVGDSD